jgi:hypothetical protein
VVATDFFGSIDDYCAAAAGGLVTTDPSGGTLYHRVEGGEISQSTFERDSPGCSASLQMGASWDCGRPWSDRQMIERPGPPGWRPRRCRHQLLGDRPYQGYRPAECYDALVVSGEVASANPTRRSTSWPSRSLALRLPAESCWTTWRPTSGQPPSWHGQDPPHRQPKDNLRARTALGRSLSILSREPRLLTFYEAVTREIEAWLAD